MEVFWLVISIVVGFFSGCVFLGTIFNNQKDWDEMYKKLNENKPVEVPEETVYDIVIKCHTISGIILCISLIIVTICILNLF